MKRAWVAVSLACLLACSKDHEGERDTKGRSSATIGGSTPIASADAAADAGVDPKSQVEGSYVTLAWSGTITQKTGTAPPVGTACTLSVHGGAPHPRFGPGHDAMSVTCGDKTLFDEKDVTTGATNRDFELTEYPVAGEVSAFRYELRAYDRGERTGRNQLDARTAQNELTVYSETIPTFRVTIKLAGKRDVRRGKPLFFENIPPFDTVSKWTATLGSSKGALPFAGKTCTLRVSPGDAQHNCRAMLECDKTMQYGADPNDFCECNVDHGNLLGVADKKPTPVDGDPSLVTDFTARTMTFADEPAGRAPWSASFTLAPAE